MSTEYATEDNDLPYVPDLHIKGTISRGTNGSREFWLTRPRPRGVSIEEWDRLEQEKWDRIWGKKK